MTARTVLTALALILGLTLATAAQQTQAPLRTPDVIFVPTPQEVVDVMLKLAKVTKDDVVYDLGSGDGRIPITAAKVYGARADRKSTRLNSSHGYTSYAAFCLKK